MTEESVNLELDAERRKTPDLAVIDRKLDELVVRHQRFEVALFAENEDNEFKSVGVMTFMQKLNMHVDMVCGMARGLKRLLKFLFWFIPGIGATVIALQQLGILKFGLF